MTALRGPCLNCEERRVGCHGKNEDGQWRCEAWGRHQEEADKLRAKMEEKYKEVAPVIGYTHEARARTARRLQHERSGKRRSGYR